MNNMKLSIVASLLMSIQAMAGGSIKPVALEVDLAPMAVEEASSTNFYAGIAYSYVDTDADSQETGNAYTLSAGYKFNPYIALEARYTHTIGDMDVENLGNTNRIVTNKALYLKPQYSIIDSLNVYALLGYGEIVARKTSGTGFQWGLGLSYDINDDTALYADYTNQYDDTLDDIGKIIGNNLNTTSKLTTVGITYSF